MPRFFFPITLLIALIAGSAAVAQADYYQYTDAGGAVNITNQLESVPKKYRTKVKVIKDEELTRKDAGARKQQAAPEQETAAPAEAVAPAPAAPQGKIAELSARFPWFKPLLYLAGVFAAFLVVLKVASAVSSALFSRLIYLCFFLGVFVLLYKAYTEHLVADTMAVKEKAVNMMKKATVREAPLPGEEPAKK